MLTLVLQIIEGVLLLCFGLLALRIARWDGAHARQHQRSAWWLAGACFLLIGISANLQDVAATWAFFAGPGSRAWDTYVYWFSVGNQGRSPLIIALAAMLVLNTRATAEEARLRRVAWTVYATALLLGSALGWSERGQLELHYSNTAVFNAVEMTALFIALALALPTHSMGRYLWFALGSYTLVLMQNVGWFSFLVEATGLDSQRIASAMKHGTGTALHLLMLGIAAWKLRLAQRGTLTYGLMEVPEWR
jgi:hypothetical protein